MADEQETRKIAHKKAPHFTSTFAANVVVHGPSQGGVYHLLFHRDSVEVLSETATLVNREDKDKTYKLNVSEDDTDPIREDVARIALPQASLLMVARSIYAHLLKRGEVDLDDEMRAISGDE